MEPVVPGPIPDVHIELDEILEEDGDTLVYMPRGHAKSSKATTIFPVWRKLHGEPFIVIVGETGPQAKKLFADTLRPILNETGEYNRLHEDFGAELKIALGRDGQPRVNDHSVEFADGTAIVCISAGASTRGLKFNNQRPSLFVIDDLEEREAVQSKLQRDKTWEWFTRDLLPMRNPTRNRVVWVGTLLHEDAAMPRAEKLGSFNVIKRKAIIREEPTHPELWVRFHEIWDEAKREGKNGEKAALAFYDDHREEMDEGTEVLWPNRYPYGYLVAERRKMGPTGFGMEFQNEAVSDGNRIVNPSDIVNFHGVIRMEHGKSETWLIETDDEGEPTGTQVRLSDLSLVIAVDPAISQKDTADYFVALVMGVHPNGTRWVLDMVRDRFQVDQQVTTILNLYEKWSRRASVVAIGIEAVAYQKALRQLIDKAGTKRGLSLPTRELKPTADKLIRLQRWQPTFERKEVHVQKHVHPILVEELTGFSRDGKTRPPNDDTVDGCIYAMDMTEGLVTASVAYESIWV